MRVDIAKAYLDAAIGMRSVVAPNDAKGHWRVDQLDQSNRSPVQVICEPSGGYERMLLQAFVRAQIAVSLVQGDHGCGRLPRGRCVSFEPNRIDTEVLCSFGEAMRPPSLSRCARLEQEKLRELDSQRRHLMHLLVMEQNRGARLSDAAVRRFNRRLVNRIKKQIDAIDLLIKTTSNSS